MRFSALAIAAAASALASTASAQIVFIGNFGGSAYYANNTPATWTDARDVAAALQPGDSRLWTVNSAAEHAFILAYARSLDPNSPTYWIGMNAESNPGGGLSAYQWISGEPVTYTNFAGDAVFNDSFLKYTSFNWTVTGQWNNLGNDGKVAPGATFFGLKRSIIEVVPSPGAAALLGMGGVLAARRRRK